MTSKRIKIYLLATAGFLLICNGFCLTFGLYYSTFMPGNPVRKIFYFLTIGMICLGVFIIVAATTAHSRLFSKSRKNKIVHFPVKKDYHHIHHKRA